MNCTDIRKLLSEYLDRRLSEPDAKELESHVPACPDCRKLLEEAQNARAFVKNLPWQKLPDDFMRKMNERLDREAERKASKGPVFGFRLPLRAFAGVLALVITLVVARETWHGPDTNHNVSLPGDVAVQKQAPAPSVQAPGAPPPAAREKAMPRAGSEPTATTASGTSPEHIPSADAASKRQDAAAEDVFSMSKPAFGERSMPMSRSGAPESAGALPQGAAAAFSRREALQKGPAPALADQLAPAREWSGAFSGIGSRRQVVIKDRSSWESLWAQHHRSRSPAPAVDFDRQMVVAVFMGEKNTGGYTTVIESVVPGPRLTVRYSESHPSEGAITLHAVTRPFHIKAVDRFDGPVDFVLSPIP